MLETLGLTVAEDAGVWALRMLGMLMGIGQIILIFACLRLVFPGNPRRQIIGLLFGTFLPVHIYMSHYTTNECLGALLGTASVYVCLRILRKEQASVLEYGMLGMCLGLGMLTKHTSLVVGFVCVVALGARWVFSVRSRRFEQVKRLAVTGLVCLAVCD